MAERIAVVSPVESAFGEPIETPHGILVPVGRVIAGFSGGFRWGADRRPAAGWPWLRWWKEDASRFIPTSTRSRRTGVVLSLGVLLGLGRTSTVNIPPRIGR